MFNLKTIQAKPHLFCLNNQKISGTQFLHDIREYQQKVEAFSEQFIGINTTEQPFVLRVMLFHSDTYEFAVRLFALSQKNIEIILPINGQQSTLFTLEKEVHAFSGVSDFPLSCVHLDNLESLKIVITAEIFWPEITKIILLTSGSTGQAKRVTKYWKQLNCELQCLIDTFPLVTHSVFLSTVSHQHIYGLLFRLLWPLAVGATITDTINYPEHGVNNLQRYPEIILISSPAFLKRLRQDNIFITYREQINQIFSSGGPLADSDAINLYEQLQCAITQVYGSTETGGIGYREVTQLPAEAWRTFEQISLNNDTNTQQLILNSPYITEENLRLDDKGKILPNNQFTLLGRIDRTIKIEEKRVNLDHIEQILLTSSLIQTCRIIVLTGQRTQLAAIICLTIQGENKQQQLSPFVFNQLFKSQLLQHFEQICLPRKWRYLKELPYNSQGKLNHSELEALFE